MENNKNIFLIGFMGVGKSTVAGKVAQERNATLIEMDETIESEEGMAITEIFSAHGEAYFRDLESALVERIAKRGSCVVSCGGGAVLREENVARMRENGVVCYLSARPETIFERVRYSTNRPLLNGNMNVEYIAELMKKRIKIYESASDVTVETDNKTQAEVVQEILAVLQ